MVFKRVSNGDLPSISYRILKWGHKNILEIKHKNACKQTQIPQEYAKVSNAPIRHQNRILICVKIIEPCEKRKNGQVLKNIPMLLLHFGPLLLRN